MKESNSFGVAAMILGILSLLLFLMPYIGLPLAVLAIIFHSLQKKRTPNGMGTAGLILGIIGTVINGMMLLVLGGALLFLSAI